MDSASRAFTLGMKVIEFMRTTIMGHERGMAKVAFNIIPSLHNYTPEMLKSENFKGVIAMISENYFNNVYDGLSKKTDPYILELFQSFTSILDHSPICLINVIAIGTTMQHVAMDRSKLDISNYESYLKSVIVQIDKLFGKEFMLDFIPKFDHRCTGPKEAEPIKPNENGGKMFKFTASPIEGTPLTPESPAAPIPNFTQAKNVDKIYKTEKLERKCKVCEKESSKTCSRCKQAKYCSAECQKKDWPTHSKVCNKLTKIPDTKWIHRQRFSEEHNKRIAIGLSWKYVIHTDTGVEVSMLRDAMLRDVRNDKVISISNDADMEKSFRIIKDAASALNEIGNEPEFDDWWIWLAGWYDDCPSTYKGLEIKKHIPYK